MRNKINVLTTRRACHQAVEAQRYLIKTDYKGSFNFIAFIDTFPKSNLWNIWEPKLRVSAEKIILRFCRVVILMPEGPHIRRASAGCEK